MKFSILQLSALLAAATSVSAQQSVPFTHPQTGLRFQSLTHPSSASSFSLLLPPAGGPTNEFIGQISSRTSNGWMGISLGGGMLNNLLVTAWQSGSSIVHSLRLTPSYGNPATYTRAGPTLTPICTSTQTNSTHWTLTFICTNCHTWTLNSGQVSSINLGGDYQVMGYAGHTSQKVTTPSNAGSAIPKHNYQGQFGMNLQAARVSQSEWDAFKRCERASGGNPGTTPSPTTTSTTTRPSTTTSTYTPPPTPTEVPVQKWGQCGGNWYNGSKTCVAGTRCVFLNDGYSQCQ